MAKKFRDISNYTAPRDALELFGASLRQGLVYDAYGVQTDFRAIVLSRPISFSKGVGYNTGFYDDTAAQSNTPTARFVFKARILGSPSPHDFLPNPCNPTYAVNGAAALEIIGMHTKFISPADYRGRPPLLGDIVNVKLVAGAFSYNLQEGEFASLASRGDGLESSNNSALCSMDLKALFKEKFELADPALYQGGGECASSCRGNVHPGGTLLVVKNDSGTFSTTKPIATTGWSSTSRFGPRLSPVGDGSCACHRGEDIGARSGTALVAIANGTIARPPQSSYERSKNCGTPDAVNCDDGGGYGNNVVIKLHEVTADGDPIYVLYAHLLKDSVTVEIGATVTKGQKIGAVGSTGSSTGPHLHIEVSTKSIGGDFWDPTAFIAEYNT